MCVRIFIYYWNKNSSISLSLSLSHNFQACSDLLSKGIHPTLIADSFKFAAAKTEEILMSISKPVDLLDRTSVLGEYKNHLLFHFMIKLSNCRRVSPM